MKNISFISKLLFIGFCLPFSGQMHADSSWGSWFGSKVKKTSALVTSGISGGLKSLLWTSESEPIQMVRRVGGGAIIGGVVRVALGKFSSKYEDSSLSTMFWAAAGGGLGYLYHGASIGKDLRRDHQRIETKQNEMLGKLDNLLNEQKKLKTRVDAGFKDDKQQFERINKQIKKLRQGLGKMVANGFDRIECMMQGKSITHLPKCSVTDLCVDDNDVNEKSKVADTNGVREIFA